VRIYKIQESEQQKDIHMSTGLMAFLALFPILVVFLLIVLLRKPATKAMPLAYLVTCILAFFVWKVPMAQISAASVDGLITAASILYIIIGAIFLLNLLQESGAISTIRRSMYLISPDRRIQAIIIAFLFGSFIEGSAGFGTPATGAATLAGQGWTAFAALIGAMGAFIAGSNTFSNMMFSLFQFTTALKIGLLPSIIVALQAVGGAAGNMICVHNVVAASAVVGLSGKEGSIIRKTLIPMTYYLIAAALLGFFFIQIGFRL
jgi:L-lactate permease